jgi:hypothetical protein
MTQRQTTGSRRLSVGTQSDVRGSIDVSEGELAAIEQAAPLGAVAGSRYDERQMDMLDSEH